MSFQAFFFLFFLITSPVQSQPGGSPPLQTAQTNAQLENKMLLQRLQSQGGMQQQPRGPPSRPNGPRPNGQQPGNRPVAPTAVPLNPPGGIGANTTGNGRQYVSGGPPNQQIIEPGGKEPFNRGNLRNGKGPPQQQDQLSRNNQPGMPSPNVRTGGPPNRMGRRSPGGRSPSIMGNQLPGGPTNPNVRPGDLPNQVGGNPNGRLPPNIGSQPSGGQPIATTQPTTIVSSSPLESNTTPPHNISVISTETDNLDSKDKSKSKNSGLSSPLGSAETDDKNGSKAKYKSIEVSSSKSQEEPKNTTTIDPGSTDKHSPKTSRPNKSSAVSSTEKKSSEGSKEKKSEGKSASPNISSAKSTERESGQSVIPSKYKSEETMSSTSKSQEKGGNKSGLSDSERKSEENGSEDESSDTSTQNKIDDTSEDNAAGLLVNPDEDAQDNDLLIKLVPGSGATLTSREHPPPTEQKMGLNSDDESIDVENVRSENTYPSKRRKNKPTAKNRQIYPVYKGRRRRTRPVAVFRHRLPFLFGNNPHDYNNRVDQELLLPIVSAGQGKVLPPVHRGVSEEWERGQPKKFVNGNVGYVKRLYRTPYYV